ncbi:MAG: hypothetical protein MJ094_07965 [Saccharofermentans sp.]|nr:hypothetical protein [Saccharofermentans sp.]
MQEESLKAKLKTMKMDLTFTSKEAIMLIGLLTDGIEDKEEFLKHVYFSEHAPVKVLNSDFLPSGQGDATAEIIDVSLGYDHYYKSIVREAYNLLDKHNRAFNLFINMLELPYPYSQLLYLKYFKTHPVDEICSLMYISKSGFYRKYQRAASLLLDKMNS